MKYRFRSLLILPFLLCVPGWAQSLSRDTIPGKWIDPLLPEDLPKLEYPAYYNDLDKARLQAFTGRYKLALLTVAKVKDGDPVEAALIKARALAATGRAQEAMELLSSDDPRMQVLRANLLAESGKQPDAIAILKQVIAKNPKSIAANYHLGEISEQIGDLDTARKQYAWFVEAPQEYLKKLQTGGGESLKLDSAEDITLVGRALDRWAALNSEYQKNESLHNTILNCFVYAYDVVDRQYWPAHVAAAEYFLSHDNSDEAGNELKRALSANAQHEQTINLLGMIAISQYNFDGGDRAVAKIRAFNPGSIKADILEARNLLHQRRPEDAQKPIQRILHEQPNNIEALGLLAATDSLRLRDEQATAALKQVEAIDPDNASAYLEVAEQLAAMRQYPRAAAMYKVAIDRAPWWTAARNGLGLLYTQSGDEDLARVTLDAAHTIDPFNMQTTNYLRLLDDLATFARKESTNFIVMYDAKRDPVIPEYFSEYLETVHNAVCGDFHHTPAVKTYIEVFPTHDAFSVRTTGSPWIGTVGASTGRVIALCAPRGGENTLGTYNWSQVLRHEFTHTVTLSMTDNRIPHWMTEGLAVWEEHTPLRWEWIPMIYHAVTHDELFDLDDLTWGFVRPKKPTDRQMAYAESFWICTYLEEKFGHESILKMLDGFKAGQSEEQVFESVLGKSRSQFYDDFQGWAKKQVASWGYDEETTKKYDALREKAEEMIKARQFDQAIKAWEEIAALRPVDALPHQRLAGLYLTKQVNKPEKAIEHLVLLSQVELKDNRYAKRVARLYRDAGKLDDAQRFAMTAVYTDPYDLDAHELLAEICEKQGNDQQLAREQRVIPVLKQWIADNRKRSLGESN